MIEHIKRAKLFLLPMLGIFVGAVAGVVWQFAVRLGRGRTCPIWAIYSGAFDGAIIVATCGSFLALGIWAMRAINKHRRRTIHGCLIAATLIGALVGQMLGSMLSFRASNRPFVMDECGTLMGAIAGVWIAVSIEVFGTTQPHSARRLQINLAVLFKFVALISLTLAVIRIVVDWMDVGQISHPVGWELMELVNYLNVRRSV